MAAPAIDACPFRRVLCLAWKKSLDFYISLVDERLFCDSIPCLITVPFLLYFRTPYTDDHQML